MLFVAEFLGIIWHGLLFIYLLFLKIRRVPKSKELILVGKVFCLVILTVLTHDLSQMQHISHTWQTMLQKSMG